MENKKDRAGFQLRKLIAAIQGRSIHMFFCENCGWMTRATALAKAETLVYVDPQSGEVDPIEIIGNPLLMGSEIYACQFCGSHVILRERKMNSED